MIYRQATESDFPQLAELRWIHLSEDEEEKDLSCYDKKIFLKEFTKFLKQELKRNYRCFVAEDKNQIISNIYLGLIPKTPKPYPDTRQIGYITNVHTLKAYRSQGVGTKLMNYVKEYARKTDCELLFVWPSDRAVPYYKRLGFQIDNDVMECPL